MVFQRCSSSSLKRAKENIEKSSPINHRYFLNIAIMES